MSDQNKACGCSGNPVEAAQSFKKDVGPLFIGLTAFGDGYKALYAITEAIDVAYGKLDIEKPPLR